MKKISQKETIIIIFQKLFSKYSNRFTSSELLNIAQQIAEVPNKGLTYKIDFGCVQKNSNYCNSDVYSMMTEKPWEIASRESNSNESNYSTFLNTQDSIKNIFNQ